ncbi:alpha/beta hydrolase [Pseudonocardia sp. KRD-184]|uniref:Alpha/beta hydrolase n=2 Tax=Pseudonocardia oceani TaxID=2792013 RepID=A0ABS6U8J8_9PSEU|nr:alpha/beta hydrolase [Pseudonocardia oceani]MBW0099522.1 alpha/beta hydrolase [Pseudonocardia oceani]MBW0112136.1 alpha/beta hydrolase [Pseudonocardia oceani]MBW0124671.1 alpha/beta hydrolase [Pseudonocardia oceani]MBW0128562.1 alpha/beta hydrolase [Pseudonocardia oceani]
MRAPDPSSVRVPGPWSHREVSANGIRQHVVECGDGPLVVLLHGFPEFWWTWRHQLVALAEGGFRAVAVDLRGYGDTDKPPRGYDLWTLAGDAAGLIGALGDTRAHVVGHDWGGLIAWTMTALQPRRVRSLTVLGAPHPLAVRSQFVRDLRGQGRATASYALAFQVPRWPERALRVDDGARVERILRGWAGPGWAATDDFAEAAVRCRSAIRVPGVVHCAMEYYRWALRSQFRGDGRRFAAAVSRPVDAPVLQVHGALDPCLLPSTAARSGEWAAGPFRSEVLDGVGHFPHQERPDVVNALLAGFLTP